MGTPSQQKPASLKEKFAEFRHEKRALCGPLFSTAIMFRLEVNPDEFTKMTEENNRKKITESFKNIGFTYTAMDLMGYRTGSMNETLENRK